MQKEKTLRLLAVMAATAVATCMIGCTANPETTETVTSAKGQLLLSVNPEIEIVYDEDGEVLSLNGLNEEGQAVLSSGHSYIGSDCDDVIKELVKTIYNGGYIENSVIGNDRNIVIVMHEGSIEPDDDFMEDIEREAKEAVEECTIESHIMVVTDADLDDNGRIGLPKAQEIVMAQLGLTEADFSDKEYKLDDGIYELEFTANGVEYEYEVDAFTGKVLEVDIDNDDWDDDDIDDNDDVDDDDVDDVDDDDDND